MNETLSSLETGLANNARKQILNGREYIVADVVMLKEGVLNGSKGPLFYPAEEIAKRPGIWNGYPLTANHPSDQFGNPVSARSPAAWQSFTIGHVFNDRYNPDTSERIAEAWFDIELTNRVNPNIIPAVFSGKRINVSTGLFTSDEKIENTRNHKGKEYQHIARNYQPDHLAVLLNDLGACSVRDGCGININSSTVDKEALIKIAGWLDANGAMPGYGQVFIKGTEVWYVGGDGDDWSEKNLPIKKFSQVDGVTKVYYEAEGFPPKNDGWIQVNNQQQVSNMRKDLVTFLVTNCDCWKGKEAVLNDEKAFTEQDLQKFKDNAEANTLAVNTLKKIGAELKIDNNTSLSSLPEAVTKAVTNATTKPKDPDPNGEKPGDCMDGKKPAMNAEQVNNQIKTYLSSLSEKERIDLIASPTINNLIKTAETITNEKKVEIIKALTANISDLETKKAKILSLNKKSLEDLKEMHELLGSTIPANNKSEDERILANYLGNQGASDKSSYKKTPPADVLMPTLNMGIASADTEVIYE